MKKILSIIILIFILGITEKNVSANVQDLEISGLKSSEMSIHRNNFKETISSTINDVSITGNLINLKGEIDGDIFNFSGEIFNSELHENELVVNISENNSNFNIIFMSIILDGKNRDDFIIDNNYKNNILKLYLEKNNEYYVFEFNISGLDELKTSTFESLPDNLIHIEHWWVNVFTPNIESIESNMPLNSNDYGNVVSETKRYSYPQTNYEYYITLLGEIDTKDIQNNNTDGNITLFIEKQETWYNGQYLNNNAHLGIANSEISVKLDANNNDKFSGLGWNTYSSYANSPINIGISYGFGPIDISYRSTEYDISGNLSIPKTSSHIVKYMEIANNYPIEAVRDSHQVYYDIYQDGYHSGIHYITANLEYTIFFVNKHGKFENGKMTLRGGYH